MACKIKTTFGIVPHLDSLEALKKLGLEGREGDDQNKKKVRYRLPSSSSSSEQKQDEGEREAQLQTYTYSKPGTSSKTTLKTPNNDKQGKWQK